MSPVSNRRRSLVLAAVVLLSVGTGCGSSEEAKPVGSGGSSGPAGTETPTAPSSDRKPPSAKPVDACAVFDGDAFQTVTGQASVTGGDPIAADGSLLGGCNHVSADGHSVMVSFRPADEWEASVKAYDLDAVTGLEGIDARYSDDIGLLARFEGKPWFAQILAGKVPDWDRDTAAEVAKVIQSNG